MNIRQAILKAADHIERNPSDFQFSSLAVPGQCGTPGCALGWIGYFGCVKSDSWLFLTVTNSDVARFLGLETTGYFYNRVGDCSKQVNGTRWYEWHARADLCAAALRLYADRYHPESNFARDIIAKVQGMAVIAEGVE